jgi:hypothetical protein
VTERTPIDTLAELVDRARDEYERADLEALVQTFLALKVTANNCEVRARLRLKEQWEALRNGAVLSEESFAKLRGSETAP